MPIMSLTKSFWTETSVAVTAVAAAALAYWAEVKYLPSIFVIVAALMVTGLFAEIEDQLLVDSDVSDGSSRLNYKLYLVRIGRASLLLLMGVVAIALML